ncbi:MAG: hypothetical protein AABW58_00250 [Nanoarchaeota archaeon]
MKRVFLFVLLILLVNPFAYSAVANYGYGGGSGGLDVSRPDENQPGSRIFFRLGDQAYIKNKGPIAIPNFPSNSWVVSGNLVEFNWGYSDFENDEILGYSLEIDDDVRFVSPFSYYGISENARKIFILEGDRIYYWRIRAKDAFGWGEFSGYEEFYLDLSKKVCEDGTPYFQCSISDFKYCDAGELVDDCSLCGCPLNSECTLNGACVEKTCFDGTRYGFCSSKKPNFCQNGEIKEVCSLCGCDEGKECDVDGGCKSIVKEEVQDVEIERKGFFSGFFSFLKNVLGF